MTALRLPEHATYESVWKQMVEDVKALGAQVGSFHFSTSDKGVRISMTWYPKDIYGGETVQGYDWGEVLAEVRRRIERTKTIEMKLIG